MGLHRVNPTTGKLIILIFGIVVIVAGLHSHYQSVWVKEIRVTSGDADFVEVPLYEICHSRNWTLTEKKCPDISMERYFVAMIIICFLLSVLSYIAGYNVKLRTRKYKLLDIGYHGVSVVLLSIAGFVYMVSALQIYKLFHTRTDPIILNILEKLAAGFLTVVQSLIYGVVAILMFKEHERN